MRILFTLVAVSLSIAAFAQDGIQFREGEWAEILAQAEREDKLIFMDAYTTWCGPCKRMAAEVFTEPEVGRFYNENFINVKIDMEKGEGVELARQYDVYAYPTLLFINGEGELVHRGLGYQDFVQFMALGRQAADEDNNLMGMNKRFAQGDRSSEFLYDYAFLLRNIRDQRSSEVAAAYMKGQEDWATDDNREFIMAFTQRAQGPLFEYIAQHRAEFEEQFGKAEVVDFLQRLVIQEISHSKGSDSVLEDMEELLQRTFPDVGDMLMARFRMTYYQRAHDTEKFVEAAIAYLEEYGSEDAMELNNVAWYFYEEVTNAGDLQKALSWAQQSVKLDANYYNMDTLAALYYKIGDQENARVTAEAAIEMAKANNENYNGTLQLLEKIERM